MRFILFIFIIGFMCPSLINPSPKIIEKLNSVTSFQEIDQLYKQLRESDRPLRIPTADGSISSSPLDLSNKTELCKNIFPGSFYFKDEKLVNPEEVRQYLKDNYGSIYEGEKAVFELEVKKSFLWKSFRRKYVNASRPLKVFAVDTEFVEDVFSCLIRDQQSPPQIIQYFVSESIYDVTETGEFHVIGRFVFVGREEQLVVHALAEEPAKMYKDDNINKNEVNYMLRRLINLPVQNLEMDPVCKLNVSKKLRLCTAVLTGLYLQWKGHKVEFHSDLHNVERQCQKKKVFILTASLNPETNYFEEWMIGCKAVEDGKPTIYYISRAYEYNKVFVYKITDDDENVVSLHHYSLQASVLTVLPEPEG